MRIWSTSEHAAQTDFESAVSLMPRSPDPHLGLARIDVYSLKNIGKAMAELQEAQRLGFRAGSARNGRRGGRLSISSDGGVEPGAQKRPR